MKIQQKKQFSEEVLSLVNKGSGYLDAISRLMKEKGMDEISVVHLLEDHIKENLEIEVRELRLLKIVKTATKDVFDVDDADIAN